MRELREKIEKIAAHSTMQACFVTAEKFLDAPNCTHYSTDPQTLLPGAKSIVVLFAGYHPINPSEIQPDRMFVSEYYLASQQAYLLADRVSEALRQEGFHALKTHSLPVKSAALRCGGFLGKNGLYFHPEFGSCVNIQLVLTDAPIAQQYNRTQNKCTNCGRCMKKCPSGAISEQGMDEQKCLRMHFNSIVPEELRTNVYQLFGCERCQAACPINPKGEQRKESYPLLELLAGQPLKELQALVGTNTARKKKIQSQAILYAGARRAKEMEPLIRPLLEDPEERVRTHAAWALKRFQEK